MMLLFTNKCTFLFYVFVVHLAASLLMTSLSFSLAETTKNHNSYYALIQYYALLYAYIFYGLFTEHLRIICSVLQSFCYNKVQLKGNLMPARKSTGEKVWVNLQAGVGARNILHQPGGHLFQSSFLNTLILTVVQATLLHYLFTVVCESLSESSRVIID